MFLYNSKRLKKSIALSAKDLSLLHLICDLGFVNDSQIHLLYSVVQRYPSVLAHSILSKWSSFSGLLQKRDKPKSISSSNVVHTVYIPTKSCRLFLHQQHIPVSLTNDVAVNSHNEQAIEVIVQALYSACFKYATYGINADLFTFSNCYRSLGQPEKLIGFNNKSEVINQKSKAPFGNQIFFNQNNVISDFQSDFLNQIMQSERSTGSLLSAAAEGSLKLWLERHLLYIKGISNTYPIEHSLPLSTKHLYDSLLDGSITNKQLQYLVNGLTFSTSNGLSANKLPIDKRINGESAYSREKEIDTSANYASKAALTEISGCSSDSDSSSFENYQQFRDAPSFKEDKGTSKRIHKDSSKRLFNNEISDSQAQLDSLLGMHSTGEVNNSVDISGSSSKKQFTNRNERGTVPELTRKKGISSNKNMQIPDLNRNGSGTLPEDFHNNADKYEQLRDSNGMVPEPNRKNADSLDKNMQIPHLNRNSSGTLPEDFHNNDDKYEQLRGGNGMVTELNRKTFNSWTPLVFSFPTLKIRQTIQEAPQMDFFFERIAAFEIYLKFDAEVSKTESNKISEKSAFRYPTPTSTNLFRNLNLISNPNLDLYRFDTSSFKNQYKYHQYTFVADEMLSFPRHGRRQEVFVELDNRTESNKTQIQKILNYINYALQNPQRDILLSMAITDGSLSSKRVPSYSNIGRKLATLADKFMKSFIPDKNGEKKYLSELYHQASNLHIVFTGVSESHIDISQFILGSNYSLDYLQSIESYVNNLNNNSDWTAEFTPSNEFQDIISNSNIVATSLNDLDGPFVNSQGKGIWRYVKGNQSIPLLGKICLKNRLSRDTLTQPIIAGNEHSLDTVLDTYKYIYLSRHDKSLCPPLVVYPTRERPVTAITLNEYKNLYNWTNNWRASIPVLYQPLDHTYLQLHKELRWLTMQYDLDIYNFFKHGYINKAALSKGVDYGSDYIEPLKYAFNMHPRTYNELHDLALSMDKKEFVDQLKLNEIPLSIFKIVMKRWPKGQYSLPLIKDLEYLDQNQVETQHKYLNLDAEDCLYAPNSIYPDSRFRLTIKKSY